MLISVAKVPMDWISDILDPYSCCLQQDQGEVFFAVAGSGLDLAFVFPEKGLLVVCLID